MTKKNPKRSSQRKEQSERDKAKHLEDTSVYGQLAAFQQLLGLVQSQGMHGRYIPIPFELIDLTASFIASLISGNNSDFLLVTPPLGNELELFRENVNFIRKTLSRAQISCSSLICSLWYIDQYFVNHNNKASKWNTRDLFMASIVVAEKFLADVTWLNTDWSEWTHYSYSTTQINLLEKRFLNDINFNLYISPISYSNFVSYLEFQLHTRQLLVCCGIFSYRDIDVLSQSLNPEYVKRLGLNLRPFEAMILLAKQATSIFVMYAATLATLVSAGYWIVLQLNKEEIAMIILSGIDIIKYDYIRNNTIITHRISNSSDTTTSTLITCK